MKQDIKNIHIRIFWKVKKIERTGKSWASNSNRSVTGKKTHFRGFL